MIKIKISCQNNNFPLIRQTPGANGVWGNCKFFINQEINECDYWIIYEDIDNSESCKCPLENVIFISGEPQSVKQYNTSFLKQFPIIMTTQNEININKTIHTQTSLPWLIGVSYSLQKKQWNSSKYLTYDDFKNKLIVKKDKLLSVCISNKTSTKGHRDRLKFVEQLKEQFGSELDIYGRGFNEIEDKGMAIFNYKYCIVIENCQQENYWTEKLADTFLGGAYPIYYGCSNIFDYFNKASLTCIDIYDIHKSINIINGLISNNQFEKSLEHIKLSRELILDQYNLFELINKYIVANENKNIIMNQITIKPHRNFRISRYFYINGKPNMFLKFYKHIIKR